MSTQFVIDALAAKVSELNMPFPMKWRWIQHAHPHSIHFDLPISGNEPEWSKDRNLELVKGARNWFYADLAAPETSCAVPLAGTEALVYISGYAPFTLWIDGVEAYCETHVWHATGPIADPLPVPIDPGHVWRLVIAVEPTDLPNGVSDLLNVQVNSRVCMDLATELSAAASQLRFAGGLIESDDDRRLVDQAGSIVDLDALRAERWTEVAASIGEMECVLAGLSQRAKAHVVHLVGHTHIDMDWMWTWDDTVHCIRRDYRAVTDILADYPDATFTSSQIPTYDVTREMDPDVFERVRALVAQGRWEVAAATWVEGDLNMADGESIARQLLYAADWATEHLGKAASIYWAPDNFGHPGNMPQIAALGEKDSYFQWRCNPGRDNNWPVRTWIGIDGTPTTSFASVYGGGTDPVEIVGKALEAWRFGLRNAFHVWGGGDHGGALSRMRLDNLALYRDKPLIPTIKFGTMAGLLAAIEAEGVKLPANTGETYSLFEGCFTTHAQIKKYNRACEGALLTAETMAAIAGMDAVARLREAWVDVLFNQFHDIFCGASVHDAYINAYARAEAALATAQAVIDEALSPGTEPTFPLRGPLPPATGGGGAPTAATSPSLPASGRVAFRPGGDPEAGVSVFNPLGFSRTGPVAVALPASGTVAFRPGGDPEAGVSVFNPLGFSRTGPVAVALPASGRVAFRPGGDGAGAAIPTQILDDRHVFIATDLPAFGAARFDFVDGSATAAPVAVTENERDFVIDTAHARIVVSKDSGCIGSYFDKALGREFVAYGVPKTLTHMPTTRTDLALNVFQVLDEAPNEMSAWLINDILRQENLLRGAQVTLVQTGPVFAQLRVKHAFRSSSISEDITIYNDFPRVDFEATIDWRERGSEQGGIPQLKVSFATGLAAARARFEGPFTVVERPADGTEQPTQKWVDVTGDGAGFALYNDCKYGCDVLGGRARITLLRNPYGPDAEPDNGTHTVRFAFEPHGPVMTNAELVRRGMAFNRPVLTVPLRGPAPEVAALEGRKFALATWEPTAAWLKIAGAESVVCSSLRRAEHSDGVLLRLWETSGGPCSALVHIGRPVEAVCEVNFLENPTGGKAVLVDGAVQCDFRGFEIKTLWLSLGQNHS